MTYSCPYGWYPYVRILFGVAPVNGMYQNKIVGLFSDISNIFGIADGILVVGFDTFGRDHIERLEQCCAYVGRPT